MTPTSCALDAVHQRISHACVAAGRPVQSVQLLAVSKTFPASAVVELAMQGQRLFGENYVQEGIEKIAQVNELTQNRWPLEWHFIGPLQSNKTRPVAESFDWVHSVDRLKIAQRLSEQRPKGKPALQVCLQVNISGEPSKSGVSPQEALDLARAVSVLPGIQLRGLMAIPEPATDEHTARVPFAQLRALAQAISANGILLDTLSMGMSADLEPAIAEGATIVRVGTALFGQRPPLTSQ